MQRKKTALRTHAHRQASAPNHESGLIVTAKNTGRLARTARVVDNRSHTNAQAQLQAIYVICGSPADLSSNPLGAQPNDSPSRLSAAAPR